MKQPDLYYFEIHTSDVTSLVKVHRECSSVARILHTTFAPLMLTRFVTSFFRFQNSIDQAVSLNKS